MADYSKTINETIRVFGPDPTTKWGTYQAPEYVMTWGSDNWGYGSEDLYQKVVKVIDDSQASSDSINSKSIRKSISEANQFLSDDVDHLFLRLGSWYKEFVSQTNDGDDQSVTSYTAGSNGNGTYTKITDPTTTWS